MARVLHCGEVVVPGCDGVARGESDDEVMSKTAEHARDAHGITEVDEATASALMAAIRTE